MKRKHVAIAMPSTGYCRAETAQSLAQLCLVSIFACDVSVLDGRHGSSTSDGRNRLVLGALACKADGILWIDSDMMFPADALTRLLRHGKDIVGATYARRAPPFDTMGQFDRNRKTGLVEADYLPTGLLYTATSVFEKIPGPWFHEEIHWGDRSSKNVAGTVTEDVVFCRKALAAFVQPYVDLDLTYDTVHIGDQYIQIENPIKQEVAA